MGVGGHMQRPSLFGAGMFMFTSHQPIISDMNKFCCLGAGEAHIHTYRQDRSHSKTIFIQEGAKHVNPPESQGHPSSTQPW